MRACGEEVMGEEGDINGQLRISVGIWMRDTWAVEIEGWKRARGGLVFCLAVCYRILEISGNLGPGSEW